MNDIRTQVGVRKAAYGAYAPILTADKLALVHIDTFSRLISDLYILQVSGEERTVGLGELPELGSKMLAGSLLGRYVVDLNL